ncbi:QueT transporter family protein [Olsenella sp. An290]|uniref:QueT transporter family protein n=1 Tax=Olsenella sp. An290 TaxID=1965625 RepID=UPI001EF4617C|nr:QueT transporter family protein [Olsenella sp. An290]
MNQHNSLEHAVDPSDLRARRVSRIGMIAATYAALTLVALLFLGSLAWGPVQFRISEAVCVLALFTADAIPGLALGCALANLANIVLSGTGMLGMLDVVFGTLATALGAWFTWRNRRRPALALMGPVIANALIVPAYLPLMLQGIGFYTIPFTNIAIDGAYPAMYLFGLVTTALGEAVVMYALGLPLARALGKTSLPRQLDAAEKNQG